jgi:RNA polymerase sigma-70 factor (family 1)
MSFASPFDEENVLRLLSEDSKYAFQLIYNAYSNRIYKVSLSYLKSPILAEEVVQDVFFKLWFQRKNLAHLHSVEAWLYTVCKNLILNYLKKVSHDWELKKALLHDRRESEESADIKLREHQLAEILASAIANLSPQQRQIYVLSRENGLSYDAIASKLGISPLTVKTHMSRALSSIRDYFKSRGEVLPSLTFLMFIL